MKAQASKYGGVCITEEGGKVQCTDFVNNEVLLTEMAHIVCGAIDDWEGVNYENRESLLKSLKESYSCTRVVSNIEVCLIITNEELKICLLEEAASLLGESQIKPDSIKAQLLCAPLCNPNAMHEIAKICLSNGYMVLSSILNEVHKAQPLLRSFSDKFLALPDTLFSVFSEERQGIWRKAVESETVLKALYVETPEAMQSLWGSLAYSVSPIEIRGISELSSAITKAGFPEWSNKIDLGQGDDTEKQSRQHRTVPRKWEPAKAKLSRVLKQIKAIALAVEEGRDGNAQRFLRELIDGQRKDDDGDEYAVKSLCFIAKYCADMFRMDFEYECLSEALSIHREDSWAQIQYADHLKRLGRFDDALGVLEQNTETIAISLRADVYAEKGEYEKALELYRGINTQENDAVVRTAMADIFRYQGLFKEADAEYSRLVDDGLGINRALAGRAEIAKRTGRLEEANNIYKQLIENRELTDEECFTYMLAYSGVLVRMNRMREALNYLDKALELRPFAKKLRTLHAAIEGVIGDPRTVLANLPNLGQSDAFDKWVYQYIRGLFLLQLEEYNDAREILLQDLQSRIWNNDEAGLRHLGAAACFLCSKEGVEDASKILENLPDMHDAFANIVRDALCLHVAVARGNKAAIQELEQRLKEVGDEDTKALVAATREKRWDEVRRGEVAILLKLVA